MGLRDFARLRRDAPLNPFDLARFANLFVVDIERDQGSEQPESGTSSWFGIGGMVWRSLLEASARWPKNRGAQP